MSEQDKKQNIIFTSEALEELSEDFSEEEVQQIMQNIVDGLVAKFENAEEATRPLTEKEIRYINSQTLLFEESKKRIH